MTKEEREEILREFEEANRLVEQLNRVAERIEKAADRAISSYTSQGVGNGTGTC